MSANTLHGWWQCSVCGSINNPHLTADCCTGCGHIRCENDYTFDKVDELPPPPPPPKPSYRDGTPPGGARRSSAQHQPPANEKLRGVSPRQPTPQSYPQRPVPQRVELPPEGWLPEILKDKAKSDLSYALHSPTLLAALTTAPSTAHASLTSTQQALQSSLAANIHAALTLTSYESRLAAQRAATESHLLALHALERQWRAKQAEMDRALAPFSPKALYQRLASSLQEQEQVCNALEESFVEGAGEGRASEREAAEFVKRFREGRKVYYLRKEKKERWDEGRVGGWR